MTDDMAGGAVAKGHSPLPHVAAIAERILGALIRLALVLSCICLAAIILIGNIDTIGRLMSRPLTSSTEMTEALLAAAIFSALPAVQRQRAHVVVDLLKQGFGARLRYASELVSLVIGAFVLFILARQGLESGIASAQQGEIAAGLVPIPVWIAKCVAAGGLILTASEAARQLVFFVLWPHALQSKAEPGLADTERAE